MLTAEEGVDLLVYDRAPTEDHRWTEREAGPWALAASRWLRSSVKPPAESTPDEQVNHTDVDEASTDLIADR